MRDQNPFCVHCLEQGHLTPWVELDHITPVYKGGTEHEDNLQGLCLEHHAIKTRKDMGLSASGACDVSGNPIDPDHPWNK